MRRSPRWRHSTITLAAGRASVQIGYNRRLSSVQGTVMAANPSGPVAPWVDVLRVDRAEGGPLAVLFSHAAHAVAVHVADSRFTADYPGYAVRALQRQLGEGVMGLFAQGCCGDINVEPLSMGYAEAERAGGLLGEAAARAAQSAQPLAPGPLGVAGQRLRLPFAPLDRDLIAAARQRGEEAIRTLEAAGKDGAALYDYRELTLWCRRMEALLDAPGGPAVLPCELQGFALGEGIALLGLPHEMFVEYQLYLQRHSPFPHTMVFGYTNVCADYVPTAEALLLGGYEVQGAPRLYGWPSLTPACERLVKDAGISVLQRLQPSPAAPFYMRAG